MRMPGERDINEKGDTEMLVGSCAQEGEEECGQADLQYKDALG